MQTGGIVGIKIERARRGRPRVKNLRKSLLLVVAFSSVGLLAGCSGLISGAKTAIQEAFQLNPTSVSFGKVGVGKQATQSISISNTGTTTASITQATFSNPQFSLSGATFPMSMATGQSSNWTIAVTPTSAGTITGTLTVLGSDGSSSATLNLSATAVTPGAQISLSSSAVQFGTVSIGSTGNANLAISNTGGTDLSISVISITGPEFGLTGISTPKTISAGQSVPVALAFKPTAAGALSGSLTITSNDPTNPTMTVSLNGTGSTAAVGQLQDVPSSLSFGSVSVGSSGTKQITLSNTGNAAVQITSIAAAGTGFSVNGLTVPYTLNPSATATLNVIFAPTTGGSVSGNITVISDANGSPLKIPVSGTGLQAGLSVTPSSFAYGSVVDGQTKSQTFTITNTGGSSLTISQLAISGAGYSLSGLTTPASLAAGANTTFSAVFAPRTAGNLAGTVTVSSNAANSPATISLSGTGVASTVTLSANPTGLSFGNVVAGSSSTKTVTLTNSGNSSLTISNVTVAAKDVTETGITLPLTLAAGKTQTMSVKFSPTAAETVSGNITVTNSQGSSTVVSVSGTGTQAGINLTPSSASFGNVVVGAANSQRFK